jgi:nucleoside-diphosphate-sugar epimerase
MTLRMPDAVRPQAGATPRRIVVTGGSGFIGTNLVEHYRAMGEAVLSLDPRPPRHPAHRALWRRVDPVDGQALERHFTEFGPTHVLHFGARTDLDGKRLLDYDANIRGVTAVIDALRGTPSLERVVFASSRMVCRIDHRPSGPEDYSPPNPYGESKLVGELLVRRAGLDVPWAIVRPTSIWGPWFDVPYKTFFLSVARGRYVHVRGGAVDKSFGFVGNSVHQLDRVLAAPAERIAGRTFYLADDPPINVGDMAERIRRRVGARPLRTVPRGILEPIAKAGDVLRRAGWRNPPLTTFRLDNLVTEMVYDLTPINEIAGELPYTLDDGIDLTVEWMRANGDV